MALHCLSGQRKPLVELLISALKILLVPMRLIKPASHRLRGEGLTNLIDTSINHLSRIKLVSGIRNTGFQFSGIMVSSGKNIQQLKKFRCLWQPVSPVTNQEAEHTVLCSSACRPLRQRRRPCRFYHFRWLR